MFKSVEYYICFLWVVFSGFYITGITKFSPFYLFMALGLVGFTLYFICYPKKIRIPSAGFFSIICFLYFSLTQIAIGNNEVQNIFNLAFPYFVFPLLLMLFSFLQKKTLLSLAHTFIYINTTLIMLDGIWRILHPSYFEVNKYTGEVIELGLAYRYKFNSIMYLDANFVGIQALSIFFLALFLYYELGDKRMKWLLVIISFGLVLTTSRAALISTFLFYIIFRKLRGKINKIKIDYRKVLLSLAGATVLLGISYLFIKDDYSFQSKFWLLNQGVTVYSTLPIDTKLLGIGAGNAAELLTMGAHNFIVGYVLETGILGFLLAVANLIYISKKTNGYGLYVILPFLFVGFSLTTFAITYLLVEIALIYSLIQKTNPTLDDYEYSIYSSLPR